MHVQLIISLIIVIILLLIYAVSGLSETWRLEESRSIFDEYYYFDSNATTPMSKDTADKLTESLWLGNASTDYAKHNGAAIIIKESSDVVRNILGVPQSYEVCFNSGASEGNCYVFQTLAAYCSSKNLMPHVIISSIEHKSIMKCCESLVKLGRIEVTMIMPSMDGTIDPVMIAEAIKPNTKLISVMHANNETGSINNLEEIGKIAKSYSLLFHSDIAQSFCKLKINMIKCNLDIVTTSMHKIYGPLGTGAIVLSPRVASWKLAQISGTQFGGLRGGTENLPAIAACKNAMISTIATRDTKNLQLHAYKQHILNSLAKVFVPANFHDFYGLPDEYVPGASGSAGGAPIMSFLVLGGDAKQTLPGTLLISFFKIGNYSLDDRFCNIKLKESLFKRKIIVSIGSACNTKSSSPSHVLLALKAPFVIRSGVIRLSIMDGCKPHKVDYLIKNLIEAVNEQR
jgi:cysteine desulfurase